MKRRRFLELAAGSLAAGSGLVEPLAARADDAVRNLIVGADKDATTLQLLTDYVVVFRDTLRSPLPGPEGPRPWWYQPFPSSRPAGFEDFGRDQNVRFARRQSTWSGQPQILQTPPALALRDHAGSLGIPFRDARGHRGVITARYVVRMARPGSNPSDPDVLPGPRRPVRVVALPGVPDTWAIDLPLEEPIQDAPWKNEAAVAYWRALGRVRYAIPNLVRETVDQAASCMETAAAGASSVPNDPGFSCQQNLVLQGVPRAWQLLASHGLPSRGSPSVRIGILDSGLATDHRHPDIPPLNRADGHLDYVDFGSTEAGELPSHGTAVFGIIGATTDNCHGIAGIAAGCHVTMARREEIDTSMEYGSQLMWLAGIFGVVPLKFPNGKHPTLAIAPCDVVNLSHIRLGGIDPYIADVLEHVATQGRHGKGSLVVNASGNLNGSIDNEHNLSSSPFTLSIGNTWVDANGNEHRAAQSGWGRDVELTACASEFLTLQTDPGGIPENCTFPLGACASLSGTTCKTAGTSYSTAVATAIAALVLTANPALDRDAVARLLRETADRIDPDNQDPEGHWRWRHGDMLIDGPADREPVRGSVRFSKWYGYGRVHAGKAVLAALAMRKTNCP